MALAHDRKGSGWRTQDDRLRSMRRMTFNTHGSKHPFGPGTAYHQFDFNFPSAEPSLTIFGLERPGEGGGKISLVFHAPGAYSCMSGMVGRRNWQSLFGLTK